MIYMNIMGQSILVLGSVERITDLLEKRSVKYADRPRMTMLNELYVHDPRLRLQANHISVRLAWAGIGVLA